VAANRFGQQHNKKKVASEEQNGNKIVMCTSNGMDDNWSSPYQRSSQPSFLSGIFLQVFPSVCAPFTQKKNPPETETRRKLQSLSSSTRLRALPKLISSSILLWREIGSNFLCTLRISPRDYNKCEFPWPFPRHWANKK